MPQHLRTTLATAAATALAAGLLTAATGTAAAADHAAPAANGRQGDFNGDGYRDLAVAAPAATVDGKNGAGAVNRALRLGARRGRLPAHHAHPELPGRPRRGRGRRPLRREPRHR
ncbi:FG-GAP repeat protein [Streptomyces decoyicus]|uniref:FG-GAP repeat protein n=1 Tax=Streptomyces decoyicus TaxID=249567 RepID=UPI002E354416|nr:FG-GAP repeat protein [Streptomyces decoyicus]